MENKPNETRKQIADMNLDELEEFIQTDLTDPEKIEAQKALVNRYVNNRHSDKAAILIAELIEYSKLHKDRKLEASTTELAAGNYYMMGMFTKSLEYFTKAISLAQELGDSEMKRVSKLNMSMVLSYLGRYDEAIEIRKEDYIFCQQNGKDVVMPGFNLGAVYYEMGSYKESILVLRETLEALTEDHYDYENFSRLIPLHIGLISLKTGRPEEAKLFIQQALDKPRADDYEYARHQAVLYMGELYYQQQEYKKALEYLSDAYQFFKKSSTREFQLYSRELLWQCYEALGDLHNAFAILKETISHRQQQHDEAAEKKALTVEHQLELERKEKEFEVKLANTKLKTLTKIAGDIAHEVQNPLQFVNNFSEVNIELIDEMNEYVNEGNEKRYKEASKDLKDNSQKIRDHGIHISKIVDQLLEQTRKAEAGELEVGDVNEHDFSK